jgi:hypothetical protein
MWAALFGGRPSSMPKPSKQNQIKPSKKAWISLFFFGRIGTFQWVTRNPSKKISSAVTLWLKYHKGASHAPFPGPSCATLQLANSNL